MSQVFDKSKLEETKATDELVTISYNDKDVYMAECPVDKKTAIEVAKHSEEFIKDVTSFVAEVATERFKDDSKLEQVIVSVPYGPTGTGSVKVAATREKTFRVPGSDNKTISRPDITTKVTHASIKAGKKHIETLQDAMLDALKK